jgi:hypothetical protein
VVWNELRAIRVLNLELPLLSSDCGKVNFQRDRV